MASNDEQEPNMQINPHRAKQLLTNLQDITHKIQAASTGGKEVTPNPSSLPFLKFPATAPSDSLDLPDSE